VIDYSLRLGLSQNLNHLRGIGYQTKLASFCGHRILIYLGGDGDWLNSTGAKQCQTSR
jgi:hypothetical protein